MHWPYRLIGEEHWSTGTEVEIGSLEVVLIIRAKPAVYRHRRGRGDCGSKTENGVAVIVLHRHAGALVKYAVPRGDVDIISAVQRGSASCTPDSAVRTAIHAAHSVRRRIENAQLFCDVGSAVAEQPAVIGRGVLVRGKCDIDDSVGRQRQA